MEIRAPRRGRGPPQALTVNAERKAFERSNLPYGPHTLTITPNWTYGTGLWVDGVISR